MDLSELKNNGWFLTSECLPLVASNNSGTYVEDEMSIHLSSEVVEVFHHPDLTMFKNYTNCYYDFIDDCWCFDELSGAPMYRPVAWRYVKK